ncbi:MAG: hypothetical protein ACRECD_15030 [Burkholderiaceae bacterium]
MIAVYGITNCETAKFGQGMTRQRDHQGQVRPRIQPPAAPRRPTGFLPLTLAVPVTNPS